MIQIQADFLGGHVAAELAAHRRSARRGDRAGAWPALERAHILSQPLLWPHLRVHAAMLSYGLRCRDVREVVGQLARLALAPLGALTGRLPWGNSGRARVSAFAPAAIPPKLAQLLREAGLTVPSEGTLLRDETDTTSSKTKLEDVQG